MLSSAEPVRYPRGRRLPPLVAVRAIPIGSHGHYSRITNIKAYMPI